MIAKKEIHFILVEPAVSGNIGAAARAIKTMGFTSLKLVKPGEYLNDEARMLAHGSNDILENAQVFSSFSEALADLDFTIATTAKRRSVKYNYHSCNDLSGLVSQKGNSINKIGIIFGREESGLTNEEVRACDIASFIPLNAPYPSLNLSQAVMIYAYELSGILQEVSEKIYGESSSYAILKRKSIDILKHLEIDRNPNLFYRILERLALLNEEDVHLLLSFCEKFEKKIKLN